MSLPIKEHLEIAKEVNKHMIKIKIGIMICTAIILALFISTYLNYFNETDCCMCGTSNYDCCPCPDKESFQKVKEWGCNPSSASSMHDCCKKYDEAFNTSLKCFK